MEEEMKLRIAKGCIVIMPVIGTLGLFIFTFVGKIIYGWGLFVIMLLLSGISFFSVVRTVESQFLQMRH